MRVSTHNQLERSIARFQANSSALAELQDQITSGIKLSRPSQDPAAFVEVTNGHAQALRLDTYRVTINDATTTLNSGVSALQEANLILTKATGLASQGANSTTDAEAYDALATEVDGLIQQMLNTANSQVDGRYLFSGTATATQPFAVTATDPAGRPTQIVYQGATERARGLIGANQPVDTFYNGDQIFQKPGVDVFQALMGLRDDLRNPALSLTEKEQASGQWLGKLQQAQNNVLGTVGEQSASLEAMQALTTRLGDLSLAVQTRTSELESTDLAEAVIHLQEQQNLFQATLGVTAKLFGPSFMDFVQ